MRFSKKFGSFRSWLNAKPRTSQYAKDIIRKHRLSPKSGLSSLRTNSFSIVGSKKWINLNRFDKRDRKASLEALRLIRNGQSISKASKNVNLSVSKIKRHLGKNIYKSKGRWKARTFDGIERSMNIYSNGRIKSIIVTDSKSARLIGKYFSDVRYYLRTGDQSVLKKYKGKTIKDSEGVRHSLETDPQKIRDIEDGKEDPEFFEVYNDE